MPITPTDPTYASDDNMPGLQSIADSESDDVLSDSEGEQNLLPCCEVKAKPEAKPKTEDAQPAASTSPPLFLSMDGNFRVQCRHMQTTKTTASIYL